MRLKKYEEASTVYFELCGIFGSLPVRRVRGIHTMYVLYTQRRTVYFVGVQVVGAARAAYTHSYSASVRFGTDKASLHTIRTEVLV